MAFARLPLWVKKPLTENSTTRDVRRLLGALELNTVCQSAGCPNRWECYSSLSVTFMILGTNCTRYCRFCGVSKGPPQEVDSGEPSRLSAAAGRMGLDFVVITSVTRDDLPDGGASHFARCIQELRKLQPKPGVEVLVPDFGGRSELCSLVLEASPDVFSHNVETVPRLYPAVRPGADYVTSLKILETAARHPSGSVVKSGFMLGLGETEEEVTSVLRDLNDAGCQAVTVGQYLRPSLDCLPVAEYVPPARFRSYEEAGKRLGLCALYAGPLVRSSYRAFEMWRRVNGDHYSKQELHSEPGCQGLH
ncbi:MAG: lipoyl synthase [Candidatus Eiseniibacteriota bacterium]|nr:MAG: lipoyl synthase [Candidatus Eisenbacteria bacterium]